MSCKRAAVKYNSLSYSFRDWGAEVRNYPNELLEMALAHTVADKVEAAYRRGDMLAKRHNLMSDWASYCQGE